MAETYQLFTIDPEFTFTKNSLRLFPTWLSLTSEIKPRVRRTKKTKQKKKKNPKKTKIKTNKQKKKKKNNKKTTPVMNHIKYFCESFFLLLSLLLLGVVISIYP